MLQVLSRYTTATETRNGATAVVAKRVPTKAPNYITHTAREGDSFDSLAFKYLGASYFFWKIADINPQVAFPDRIPAGTIIRIPQ